MPIYEYQCNACGQHTELLQKVSDTPATECPHCHANELKRLISAARFHLKGTGWYVTDFKDKKSQDNQAKTDQSDTKKTTKETKKTTTDE